MQRCIVIIAVTFLAAGCSSEPAPENDPAGTTPTTENVGSVADVFRQVHESLETATPTTEGASSVATTTPMTEPQVSEPLNTESGGRSPPRKPGQQPVEVATDLNEGLRMAALYKQQNGLNSTQFRRQLEAIAPLLHEAPVAVGDAPLTWDPWRPLESVAADPGLTAFRFTSPLEVPADMYWVFSMPVETGEWQIIDVDTGRTSFRSFDQRRSIAVEGVEFPPANMTIFQPLLGGQIQPGQEYIIWFDLPDVAPQEIPLAIRLVPSNDDDTAYSAAEIAEKLGVEIDYQRFEPTAEGVADAFQSCRGLLQEDITGDAFLEALWSVAPALPQVELSEGEDPNWVPIVPTESFTFNAVRCRSPHSQASHLCLAIAAQDTYFRFGMISRRGFTEFGIDNWFVLNPTQNDFPMPAESKVTIQVSSNADVENEEECILWFASREGALPDMQAVLCLVPEDEFSLPRSAQDAARTVKVDLPEVPSQEQVQAVFEECRKAIARDHANSILMIRWLHWVKPILPEITLSTGGVHWNELTLEGHPSGVYAFRFPARELHTRPLLLAVAKPTLPGLRLDLIAPDNLADLPGKAFREENVTYSGLPPLPDENVLVTAWYGGLLLEEEEDEYVIWFATENIDDTATLQLAIGFDAENTGEEPDSLRAIASRLGLELTADTTLPGSVTFVGHEDAVYTVKLAPDGETWASGAADGALCVWSKSGELLRTVSATRGGIAEMEFSPDGRTLATAHVDSDVVQLWSYPELTETHVLHANRELRKLAFSPDGSLLAACAVPSRDEASSARIWSLLDGDIVYDLPRGEYAITDAIFADDSGSALFCGTYFEGFGDQAGRFFVDLDSRTMQSEGRDPGLVWSDCDLTSNDEWVATQPYGTVGKGSPNGGPVQIAANYALVLAQAVSPDGTLLALAASDGRIQLWDIPRLVLLHQWQAHKPTVRDVAFSADGASLASAGDDGVVRIWDLDYQLQQTLDRSQLDPLVNSIGMTLRPIPAGTFEMGVDDNYALPDGFTNDDYEDEKPQHTVRISKPFYLAAHETTVGQFRQFVDATGHVTTAEQEGEGMHLFDGASEYEWRPDLNWKNPGFERFEQTDEHPVVQVSYDDAVAFCKWLSETEGETYRLPTEAEWEYACRAGSSSAWCYGGDAEGWMIPVVSNLADASLRRRHDHFDVAGHWDDGYPFTSPGGAFAPNAYGLHDMHGNVFEWCSDFYDPLYYRYSPDVDPQGPPAGENHAQRSCGFFYFYAPSRSAGRELGPSNQTQSHLGFRVLREF